ncbi:AbrB family transcriptional regulator [Lentibacter sp. XHP0401]|uniref:AbrB family transcriptional regulator n=1 Tax=Lentibacter sp. XHP0401 TaxID=2984334 RepID=UPI0021E7E450|nr:AbrB family transcriptional regulator [Lentibacter sp. XHP0401]MCV2892015.1 AbrB family transcriptional regulator [Lentibacter sp. XHP0401]
MKRPVRLPPHIPQTATLLVLGLAGALTAQALGLPLPFLLGSLLATAPVAIFASRRLPLGYTFPSNIRVPFIALIGAIIGAQVTPELVSSLHDLLPSMAAIIVFVLFAQALNYWVFRTLGGYDAPTAFYSGAPGGLIESITLGEASGADQPTLIAQQFLRIILVITLVPLGLSLWLGYPVGSAGGLSFNTVPVTWVMYPQAAAILALGLVAGRAIGLPAWQLTGALLASAGFALMGSPLALPNWVILLAQLVIGASLGMRFAGLQMRTLRRSLWLSLVSVGLMSLLGAALAALLIVPTGQPFKTLFITFAPGGVNEMALVALSLKANPAFVTLHHIFRIIVTVLLLGYVSKRLFNAHGKVD